MGQNVGVAIHISGFCLCHIKTQVQTQHEY